MDCFYGTFIVFFFFLGHFAVQQPQFRFIYIVGKRAALACWEKYLFML